MPLLADEAVAAARLPFGRAATLPSEAYGEPGVHAEELGRLFRRHWLCVARADQLAHSGDFVTLDLLREPLVVLRDGDQLRVLSRVCRHRGAEVVRGVGNAARLRCPYHAWVYELDGRLAGAPHMEGSEAFDPAACALPALRCEVWEGFVFACFDPAAEPLGPRLAGLSRLLSRYRLAEFVTTEPLVFDSHFDWKVLVDNFMEAYHHVAVHKDTLEPLFPARASWTPESDGPWSLLVMPPRHEAERPRDARAWPEASLVAGCVYPSHLFALTPDLLSWYQVLPEAPGRFTLRIHACPSREIRGTEHADALREFTRRVHLQDVQACEATFAGLRAPSHRAGVLGPLERALWQWNQWWLREMGL